jgi:hypothetical protein
MKKWVFSKRSQNLHVQRKYGIIFMLFKKYMPETEQNIASTENLADPILTRANGYFDKILQDPAQEKNLDSRGGVVLEDGRVIERKWDKFVMWNPEKTGSNLISAGEAKQFLEPLSDSIQYKKTVEHVKSPEYQEALRKIQVEDRKNPAFDGASDPGWL